MVWSLFVWIYLSSGKGVCVHCSFFYLVCEAIGTAATFGLLCQPRAIVKMIVEKQMECRLARETEVLGENLPQRHFCPSQSLTWPDAGLNPGRRGGKLATNRLSYGAAMHCSSEIYWCSYHVCTFDYVLLPACVVVLFSFCVYRPYTNIIVACFEKT
jgi:hypothetical protein